MPSTVSTSFWLTSRRAWGRFWPFTSRDTRGFNLTLGAITTAVGIGAALSQGIAGSIVHHLGTSAGFLFLAGVASGALALLYFFMPETREASPNGG